MTVVLYNCCAGVQLTWTALTTAVPLRGTTRVPNSFTTACWLLLHTWDRRTAAHRAIETSRTTIETWPSRISRLCLTLSVSRFVFSPLITECWCPHRNYYFNVKNLRTLFLTLTHTPTLILNLHHQLVFSLKYPYFENVQGNIEEDVAGFLMICCYSEGQQPVRCCHWVYRLT